MLRQIRSTVAPGLAASLTCQVRFAGQKPKKKNKVGAKFITDSQNWRDEWRKSRERMFAESLRNYVNVSSTQRKVPYDVRFKPFDREERDGVYVLMKYLMDDKLNMTHNHGNPVKRLFCNVGLIGPQVTTGARWKPLQANLLNAQATLLSQSRAAPHTDPHHVKNRFYRE